MDRDNLFINNWHLMQVGECAVKCGWGAGGEELRTARLFYLRQFSFIASIYL